MMKKMSIIYYLFYLWYSFSISLTEYSKKYLIYKGYNDTVSTLVYTRFVNFNGICASFNGEYLAFLVLCVDSKEIKKKYVTVISGVCKVSYMFNYIFRNDFNIQADIYQYYVMSYNPLSTSDTFKKLIQDIELVSGTKNLISENFLSVYQPMKILRDAYSKVGTFSVESMMNYLHNLEIKTAEFDGVKLSDSHYYTKGFTIVYLPCALVNAWGRCSTIGDFTIFNNYPTPIYANGYDLTVYIYIIIIINRYGVILVKCVTYLHMMKIIFIIIHYILE